MASKLLKATSFLCMIMLNRAFCSWNSLSPHKKVLHNARHLAVPVAQGSIEYLEEAILLRGRF